MNALLHTALRAAVLIVIMMCSFAAAQSNYVVNVHTSTGNDTLYKGVEGALIFGVDSADTYPVLAFTWALSLTYSTTNFIGVLNDVFPDTNVWFYKPVEFWAKGVRRRPWAGNPDTAAVGIFYFNEPYWSGTGEQWRIIFVPDDTGTLVIDTAWSPPSNHLSLLSADQNTYNLSWQTRTITVVPYCKTGDVNADFVITSSDIIYLVNYTFKGKAEPTPCVALGDPNCSGTINSADIIYIVRFVFKGGPPPCESCDLVTEGVWTCP